jgi:hypothetical protein
MLYGCLHGLVRIIKRKLKKIQYRPENRTLVTTRTTSSFRLNRDELYVNLGCFRKCAQVAGIRGEDVVAVGCQAHHGGIKGIGLAAAAKQHPGSPSQLVVDGSHVSTGQEPGHGRLSSAATAPDPGDHTAAGDRRASGETSGPLLYRLPTAGHDDR